VTIDHLERVRPGDLPLWSAPSAVRPRLDTGRLAAWFVVFGLASASAWLGFVGLYALVNADSLSQALATARDHSAGPVLIVFTAVILLAERLRPAVPRPLLARAHLVDAGYFVLFAVIVLPLVTLVQTGLGTEIERHASFLVLSRLPLVPQVVTLVVIFIAIDAINWAAHVVNHRSLGLWRLHALHHSQEDMSVLTTFRTHPLVHASYLPVLLPALVLGANGAVPGGALIAYACLVTLPHANLRWTFGPFGRVFVSPAYHRLHHVAEAVDPRGTVNFGFVLVLWDKLAGRAVLPTEGVPRATGIAGRPVPVEQSASGAGILRVVLAQLAQPFRIRAATDEVI
jgi:sterol desaturase/sphingolipid hydroxylase (fatty acid hydroxylase superfamily)